jgi:hypothetical protein
MLVLLLIVASATARGGGTGAPPGAHVLSTAGHHVVVVTAIVLVPILAVLGFVLVLVAQIMRRRERDPEVLRRRRNSRRRAIAIAAVILAALAYKARHPQWNPISFLHLRNPFTGLTKGHAKPSRFQSPHDHGGPIAGMDWTAAIVIWGLLLVAAVVVYLRIRGRRRELEPLALSEAADEDEDIGLDAVRNERNPRRAVIAAYALMERMMARDGIARGQHEAPMEYLGRVTLHGHRGAASVHRLTALFQRARFGHRPVDEEMRRRAIAAVEELDAGTGGAA